MIDSDSPQPTLTAALRSAFDAGLADLLPIGLCVIDAAGVILQCNRKVAELCGRRPEPGETEATFLRFRWLYHAHVAAVGMESPIAGTLADGQPRTGLEAVVERPDGATDYLSINIDPIKDNQGQVTGAFICLQDVSEQRRSQNALRANENLWQLALAAARVGIWDWNLQTNEIFWSAEFKQMLGYDPAEFRPTLGLLNALTHPDDMQPAREAVRRHLTGESPWYTHDYRLRHQNGSFRWIHARGRVLRDDRDRPIRMVGSATDITERKELQFVLKRQALLVENVSEGIIFADQNGNIVDWNPYCERVLGYRKEEVLGKPVSIFHKPEQIPHKLNEILEGLAKHGRWSGEIEFLRRDGSEGVCEAMVMPLLDEEGRLVACVGVHHDITERKQLMSELRNRAEELARANAAKDQFLAVLSHELRTPLTPVLTTVQLMERDHSVNPDVRESLGVVRRNVELEAKLIDDMLDLTRVSRGKLELKLTEVDLHEKIRHVLRMCDAEIRTQQLNIITDLTAEHHQVEADPARIQQVLWNLLKNAIKFTPAGGSITLHSENTPDGKLSISIADTGIGIEPEALPHIFDAFEQGGRDVTRLFGGLGLGLSISKALADLHGGTLVARSEGRNRGATFTLTLPTIADADADVDLGVASLAAPPQPGGKRILLVEDHGDTSRALTRVLASSGFEVHTAGSVATALQILQSENFDLVISDIGLPDGSGLDLIRQILTTRPITGIAISGYGMDEDVRRSREAGFVAHLTKPVDVRLLEDVIRKNLIEPEPPPSPTASGGERE